MKNVTFRLEDDEIARVDEQATVDKRPRSQMLRVLVAEALDAREETYAQERYGLPANTVKRAEKKRQGEQ